MSDAEIPEDARPGFLDTEVENEVSVSMSPTEDFLVEGNVVEQITREMLELEPEDRCYWFDAVYVPEFDVTVFRVSLSHTLHKFRLSRFFNNRKFGSLNYEDGETVNMDDLMIIEQESGLL